jgi:enoyl-CoA hydratase/carnithine racemase
MKMLLTGEMIDAATALRFGLVNRIVPADELKTATHDLAMRLAAKSPAAIGLGKRGVLSQTGMTLADAYAAASEVMVANMLDADAEEGIAAFFDKRQPKWR